MIEQKKKNFGFSIFVGKRAAIHGMSLLGRNFKGVIPYETPPSVMAEHGRIQNDEIKKKKKKKRNACEWMQQGDPRLPGNNGSWTDSGPTGGGRGTNQRGLGVGKERTREIPTGGGGREGAGRGG